jgi:hypothetical protein
MRRVTYDRKWAIDRGPPYCDHPPRPNIGNDGITLCRELPVAVNKGEIAIASNEELHAAQLSGKRLLALWNALPDV